MRFIVRVEEGQIIPKWYGVAWREFNSYHAICMITPFHWVARNFRWLWLWFMRPWPDYWEKRDAQIRAAANKDADLRVVRQVKKFTEAIEKDFHRRVDLEVGRRIDEALAQLKTEL